jgi:GH24 family phage-related lysozyme (muramidase)
MTIMARIRRGVCKVMPHVWRVTRRTFERAAVERTCTVCRAVQHRESRAEVPTSEWRSGPPAVRSAAYSCVFGLVAMALVACGPEAQSKSPIAAAQEAVAEALVPAIVAVQEVVEPLAPAPAPAPLIDPDAVRLIMEFEIVSAAYYNARLQSPIWPGGASGVTWCVGYDGGHQTRSRIEADWPTHPQLPRLAATAGIVGAAARSLIPGLRDVRTPLSACEVAFATVTLPRYHALAARTYRNGWDLLPLRAQGALVSVTFNRGAGMTGDSRRELRTIRDVCVPAGDVRCIARELVASIRVWHGKDIEAGMRRRRLAEADLAVRA